MKVRTQSKKVNKAWLNAHVNDPYVQLAQREGYRARAAYKLQELDEAFGLVRPSAVVVDLGSAPGAWCQYIQRRLRALDTAAQGSASVVVAVDVLPMEPLDGVTFIQGDFREEATLQALEHALAARSGGRACSLVLSDMAPNLSGVASVDGARVAHLVELAVDFAVRHLQSDGTLVAKVFHGSGYDELVRLFRGHFRTVKVHKPKASRGQSAETYLVGRGLSASSVPPIGDS